MSKLTGWIKIHRQISEKAFYQKSEYFHLWLHLLLRANHHPSEFIFNNVPTSLKAGQLLTGRKKLSAETGISESKVERILKYFQSAHQIEQKTFNRFRIITIKGWNKFQHVEHHSEPRLHSQSTTVEQPLITYNNKKKEKNKNNDENFIGLKKNKTNISFRDSKYFDKSVFEDALKSSPEPYSLADIDFYYEAAINGSDAHGYKYKNWLAAIKSWINNDIKKSQFKSKNTTEIKPNYYGKQSSNEIAQKNSEQLRNILAGNL
jgi:hypothetical protein